jgi:anthranilate/para-aminobenzoate synthase component I
MTEMLVANVGGAITSLSDAQEEYEECMLKAEAIVKAVSRE